jgi:hypothetical protein
LWLLGDSKKLSGVVKERDVGRKHAAAEASGKNKRGFRSKVDLIPRRLAASKCFPAKHINLIKPATGSPTVLYLIFLFITSFTAVVKDMSSINTRCMLTSLRQEEEDRDASEEGGENDVKNNIFLGHVFAASSRRLWSDTLQFLPFSRFCSSIINSYAHWDHNSDDITCKFM